MWADIDYMDDYKLFTISPAYKGLSEKVATIQKEGRRFVPIMDAGVAVRKDQGYKTLDEGLQDGVFIMRADNLAPLTAGVWPGHAYFPDFHNPKTVEWWAKNFDRLYDTKTETQDDLLGLKFDGIWLDENEATNFCNGYCIESERPADSYRNKPFYVPGWRDLEDQALGVDGLHFDGVREYDVHNLYPLMQSKATADYLLSKLNAAKNARPYVMTRSNFPGIGKYAHHWMGDNWSTLEYLSLSVDGVYSYNLYGMPFLGSDICGFNGDAPPDLCTRWHQLGSLYPFSRNHNQNGSASQEPYVFTGKIPGSTTKSYADVIRTALINRYSLIKYYYTSFMEIGDFGGSFFKPCFFEWQDDPKCYDEVLLRNNIMLGNALKASINTQTLDFVTNPTTDFYFPEGRWCQILPTMGAYFDTTGTNTKTQTLPSGLEDYYVHMRSGFVIPHADVVKNKVRTTQDLENLPTDIVVFADAINSAKSTPTLVNVQATAIGTIYLDDGVSYDDKARFDIYSQNGGDKTFTFNVSPVASMVGKVRGKAQEKVGLITFLAASKSDGMDKITKATLTDSKDIKTVLKAPVYDLATDTLKIEVTIDDGSKSWTFWDFKIIQLE